MYRGLLPRARRTRSHRPRQLVARCARGTAPRVRALGPHARRQSTASTTSPDLELHAIETLKAIDAPLTVTLTYEPGRVALAGRFASFDALLPISDRTRRSRRATTTTPTASRDALAHIERSLFEPSATRVAPSGAVELLEGGGERAELELVADRVRELIDAGTPPEEIAIVVRRTAPVAEMLREILDTHGYLIRSNTELRCARPRSAGRCSAC